MTAYKTLKLEFENFESTIKNYTSEPLINNLLSKLGQALKTDDAETIEYCLSAICQWYDRNLDEISDLNVIFGSNNFENHLHNSKLLHEIMQELADSNYKEVSTTRNERTSLFSTESPECTPKIFLSHRSVDHPYGDCIERLLIGIGVSNEQLIYTSHPLHKIPLNQNIYDYLRSNLQQPIFMIILWSNDYLESPACLNEMGAIWVMQSDYTNLYTPSFSFGNPKYHECAVDTRKMGAVLNGDAHCKASMRELINTICNYLSLTPNEQTIMHYLDAFIEEIKSIAS